MGCSNSPSLKVVVPLLTVSCYLCDKVMSLTTETVKKLEDCLGEVAEIAQQVPLALRASWEDVARREIIGGYEGRGEAGWWQEMRRSHWHP